MFSGLRMTMGEFDELKKEAEDFDKQVSQRIKHGFVPDLRDLRTVDWFYNNPWREPEFAKIQLFPKMDSVIRRAVNSGNRVLEVGCGYGMLSLEMARNGLDVTGIDISKKSIEIAKEYKNKNNHLANWGSLKYRCTDYTISNMKPKSYDTIIFFRSLHHFKNLNRVIRKSYDLLKEKGEIIICEPIRSNFDLKSAEFALILRTILPTWESDTTKMDIEWNDLLWDEKIQEIHKEYNYENKHRQSIMDNSTNSDDAILEALEPYFDVEHAIYNDAFIDKLIGGLRGKNRFKLARFLKFLDEHMIETNQLKPTSVTIFAKKRKTRL